MRTVHDGAGSPRAWTLWLVLLLLLAVYAPTAIWLFERWTLSIWHHGHGILIAPVVVYLAWTELQRQRALPLASSAWGFALLVPALTIHMLDTGLHSQLLSAFSLFLALPGLSLLFLGAARTRAILFPLLILFLTLPIPLFLTESIHLALRHIATNGAAVLLPLFGVPVYAHGTTLEIPNGVLQVADACSGFSTLYASITIACLVAYFCPDRRRQLLVLLVAAPLAIGVNVVRVAVLSLLVSWVGLDVLKTSAHEISGLATFAVALPVIFWLGQPPAKAGAAS